MAAEGIRVISEKEFSNETKKGLTLVDFSADWCGPCRRLAPVLDEVAKEMSGKANVVKLDIDAAQDTAAQFQVTSVPTMILFKDGQEIGRIVGLSDHENIKKFILNEGRM